VHAGHRGLRGTRNDGGKWVIGEVGNCGTADYGRYDVPGGRCDSVEVGKCFPGQGGCAMPMNVGGLALWKVRDVALRKVGGVALLKVGGMASWKIGCEFSEPLKKLGMAAAQMI